MKKKELVSKIEKIVLNKGGEVNSCDLDHTPVLMATKMVSQCVETFNHDTATVVSYVNEVETCQNEMLYKDLPKELLKEILAILED